MEGALQEQKSTSSSTPTCPRREVPDILSWVQCFGVYTAVVASKYPHTHKILAYHTLMVQEARRCGGRGWLTYDCFFRQQMAGDWRGEEWGRLNPYLFASTFLALGSSSRPNCSLRLESDHGKEDRALAKGKGPAGPKQHGPREPQLYREHEGHHQSAKGRSPRPLVCFAWNQGECTFHFCKFKHACARFGGDQQILHCRSVGGGADHKVAHEREGRGRGNGGSR